MGVFLVLLWCATAPRQGIAENSRSSRFSGFNSRQGPKKFPSSPATGIGPQAIDVTRKSRNRLVLLAPNR